MPEPADTVPATDRFGNASRERFTWSRRYAAGAGGVRGLLITMLGDYVRPARKPVPTSAFIDAMGRLGVEGTACRQALMRAAADGWIVAEREGRYTWWRLTPAFADFLHHGAEKIFGFTSVQTSWDRRWLVVVARAAETNRAGRHLLRTRLRWAGFGALAAGVWISTHAEQVKEAETILREAEVFEESQILLSEFLAGGDLATLVRQAWDLDTMEHEYESFIATYTRQPTADPIARLTQLVHAWRQFALQNPALPKEVLPTGWIGTRAASLFQRQHAKWLADATREWARISSTAR